MQSQLDSSWLDGGNQSYLENQFEAYLQDPNAVPEEWRKYFADLTANQLQNVSHAQVREIFKNINHRQSIVAGDHSVIEAELRQLAVQKLIAAYRLLGHKYSQINPLQENKPDHIAQLEINQYGLSSADLTMKVATADFAGAVDRTLQQVIDDLQKIYCGTATIEYLHITDNEERLWIQSNYEIAMLNLAMTMEQKLRVLELVVAADGLEKYLAAKYPGAKRFSLEGCDSLIVGLDEIISYGCKSNIEEIVIAMAHRGRLNVLVNLLGKVPSELFDQFEDKHNDKLESGDVKYHQGFSVDHKIDGKGLHLSLAFNPSHLEIVTPVACGSVRARQERRNDVQRERVLCVAIHGDAAFAGQGVVMEILNMSATRGYEIGGTIHIITNNQIGFTTSNPQDARSTLYCSDIGKMLSVPVFHVNADDPEAMLAVANLAMRYRQKFHKDVIIDLLGYRRMGHNEADEPAATQPIMYKQIREHPTAREIYSSKLIQNGDINAEQVKQMVDEYRNTLDRRDQVVVKRLADQDWKNKFASDWTPYGARDWRTATSTQVPLETILQLATVRDTVPEGFVLDKRVQKIIEDRKLMTAGEIGLDWGYAETLAYATLLNEGYTVRLTGQDSARGTFFHRHAVWHDQNSGATYTSLEHLTDKQAKFWIYNSLLSEEAVLAFEYGFSSTEPRCLTLWEAQFGDFANGAQVVIDQFISSGEQKWGRLSGLVMLLPHGYEGQGPEHSSARIERYLQLCAQHNIQVCIPSNPSQMFHLLRRQMLRPMRKPLIVITPKSLLRHKAAISTLDQLANGKFQVIIADDQDDYAKIDRVILCSGKIFYELWAARLEAQKTNIAILRIEQLYPFPEEELAAELSKYKHVKNIIWCQEEPHNQGAWYSTQHHLRNVLTAEQELNYAGRPDSAAPAVGYFALHEQQQKELVNKAIGIE